MSRDAFSHDPQETRDDSSRSSATHEKPHSSNSRHNRNSVTDVTDRPDSTEPRVQHHTQGDRDESPRTYYVRDRAYLLRESEMHSLREIGKFRVIPVSDLAKYAYGGNREEMNKDIRRLARQFLVADKTVEISQKKILRVVTLTKAGHRLLRNTKQLPVEQAIYHGLLKPREIKHDADLYRLYQKEASRIERSGARPLRVILDYELKRNVNRDLALLGPDKDHPGRKSDVADKHLLRVVNGKIPMPDLRIEYETPELELRHVDLELATRDYRPRAMAEKAAAGFSMYSRPEDASRLRRVLDEQEITARILNL